MIACNPPRYMMRHHVEMLAKPMQIKPQGHRDPLQRGYTLMELMIAVAIVAILATLALNSYSNATTRSRRAAIQSHMMEVASRQEQLLLDTRLYSDASPPLPALRSELTAHYTLAVTVANGATPPTFLITATPIGNQLANDTRCGTLSLNHLGVRTVAVAGVPADPAAAATFLAARVAECW